MTGPDPRRFRLLAAVLTGLPNLARSSLSVASGIAGKRQVRLSLLDQAVVSGTSFLTSILVARILGLHQFGIFTLLTFVILFAQSIQRSVILVPMLSIGPKEDDPVYYSSLFYLQLFFSAASAVICLAIVTVSGLIDDPSIIAPLLFALIATQFQEFIRQYNFTLKNAQVCFISDLVRNGVQLAGLIAIILFGYPVGLADIFLLTAFAAVAGVISIFRAWPGLAFVSSELARVVRRQVKFSRWLLGSAIMQWTTGNLFILVAGAVVGASAAGALKAAQSLLGVTHLFFQAADNFVPPRAAKIFHEQGMRALWMYIRKVFVVGMAATTAVGLTFASFPNFWMATVFGPSFEGFGGLVILMALAYLLKAGVMPLRYAFLAMENTKAIFVGSLLATAVSVAMSYPAAIFLGAYGAAIGTVAVQIIVLLNLLQHAYRSRLIPRVPDASDPGQAN